VSSIECIGVENYARALKSLKETIGRSNPLALPG